MMRKIAWNLTESGPPTTTMKSFKDAIVALEDIQNHLAASLTYIGLAVDAVAALSVRQWTLNEYIQ